MGLVVNPLAQTSVKLLWLWPSAAQSTRHASLESDRQTRDRDGLGWGLSLQFLLNQRQLILMDHAGSILDGRTGKVSIQPMSQTFMFGRSLQWIMTVSCILGSP